MANSDVLADRLLQAVGQLSRSTRTETLPPGEAAVLSYLDRDGAQSIAALAEQRGVRHQTAAKIVAQLETAGLVAKKGHPDDARMVLVSLTRKGATALKRERASRASWLSEAIRAELSADQRKRLPDVVAALEALAQH